MYFHHKALMDVKPSLKIKPPKNVNNLWMKNLACIKEVNPGFV